MICYFTFLSTCTNLDLSHHHLLIATFSPFSPSFAALVGFRVLSHFDSFSCDHAWFNNCMFTIWTSLYQLLLHVEECWDSAVLSLPLCEMSSWLFVDEKLYPVWLPEAVYFCSPRELAALPPLLACCSCNILVLDSKKWGRDGESGSLYLGRFLWMQKLVQSQKFPRFRQLLPNSQENRNSSPTRGSKNNDVGDWYFASSGCD